MGLPDCFLKQQEPLLLLQRVKKKQWLSFGHTEVIQFWMLAIGHFAKFKKFQPNGGCNTASCRST
jgi:hypothetical protein